MKALSLVLALIFAVTNIGYAAKIGDDTLIIGKDGSSANKQIQLGSTRKIRTNETTGKIEFTNDGTLYKNLGSGSGAGDGGAPIIENGSFEDGLTPGWTSSGGTLTQETYVDGLESDAKFAQFISTVSGEYFETTAKAIPSFSVGGCLAKIDYYSTDASGTWKLQVYDGSSNLLKEQSLDPKDWQAGYAPFSCPAIGTLVKMRVISTAAGTIKADRGYLGKENRTFQVAQAKVAGESYFAPVASCTWSRSSATLGAFTPTAACPGPTVISSSMGSWQTTDADLPRQTINNLPAGKYKATFAVTAFLGSAAYQGLSISDGTTICKAGAASGTGNQGLGLVSCYFDYTTSGSRTFELYGASSGAVASTIKGDLTAPEIPVKFQLEYWPTDSQTALVPDAQNFFVKARYLPVTQPTQSNAVPEQTDATLAVDKGSAKVPCGTNAAGVTSCSVGSEQLGVQVNLPTAGRYRVKSTIRWSNGANTRWRISMYQPNSNTVIEHGSSQSYDDSPDTWARLEDEFDVSAAGEYSFKVNTVAGDPYNINYTTLIPTGHPISVELISHPGSRPYLIGNDQVLQTKVCELSTTGTTSASIPFDDTIPQITEGGEVLTCAFIPKSASSKLVVKARVYINEVTNTSDVAIGALFRDSTADAFAVDYVSFGSSAAVGTMAGATVNGYVEPSAYIDSTSTSSTTFSVRVGLNNANAIRWNGVAGARIFGGILKSYIQIQEVLP
jgi:hypothetical protein